MMFSLEILVHFSHFTNEINRRKHSHSPQDHHYHARSNLRSFDCHSQSRKEEYNSKKVTKNPPVGPLEAIASGTKLTLALRVVQIMIVYHNALNGIVSQIALRLARLLTDDNLALFAMRLRIFGQTFVAYEMLLTIKGLALGLYLDNVTDLALLKHLVLIGFNYIVQVIMPFLSIYTLKFYIQYWPSEIVYSLSMFNYPFRTHLKLSHSKYHIFFNLHFMHILIFSVILLIILLQNTYLLPSQMDVTLDFTLQPKPKLSDLSQHPYLRSVTFVVPFFQESKSNFSSLWDFITFLNDKPLVKIFVQPKGEDIKPKYKTVAVGGTFDHLHVGHQVLLLHTILSAEKKVIIGVTSQQMLQKKVNHEIIQSILMRIHETQEFMRKIKPDIELDFVELQDPFGPTVTDENIDAIIVSEETLKTTQMINEKRKQKGFHTLAVEMCPIMAPVYHLTSLKSIENKISSTQIRSYILAKNGFTIQKYTQYQRIWSDLFKKINVLSGIKEDCNRLLSRKWWDIVVKYYSQYWRFYHTNHHINCMFRQLKQTFELGYDKLTQTDKVVLQVAIFFHDIIYRPDLKTNEQDSANFAQSFINEIWGDKNADLKEQITERVKKAIMGTKLHTAESQVGRILNELDMSILDSSVEKYKVYAYNIECEYRPLYKETYPKLRVQFLKKNITGYKYNWRKGANIETNINWEIGKWQEQNKEL